FDAISQEDYYALAGYLQSSAYRQARFETLEHNADVAAELDRLDAEAIGQQLPRFAAALAPGVAELPAYLTAASDLRSMLKLAAGELGEGAQNAVAARAKQDGLDPQRLVRWVQWLSEPGH